MQLTLRGSAGITVSAFVRLVAGHRRDAGAPDEAKGGQTGSWQGGEARRTETGLAWFEQEALGGGLWTSVSWSLLLSWRWIGKYSILKKQWAILKKRLQRYREGEGIYRKCATTCRKNRQNSSFKATHVDVNTQQAPFSEEINMFINKINVTTLIRHPHLWKLTRLKVIMWASRNMQCELVGCDCYEMFCTSKSWGAKSRASSIRTTGREKKSVVNHSARRRR